LCSELLSYDILRGLFLSILYSNQPTNVEELYLGAMKRINENGLFEESSNISATVKHYLSYFIEEFDVS